LAKVLIQKPRIAILDEPTAQVDVLSKHALWDVIKKLRSEGTTVIIATNDMFEAERVCERIAIIYRGKLRALGTISELKDSVPKGDIIEIQVQEELRDREALRELEVFGRVSVNSDMITIYSDKAEEKVVDVIDALRKRGLQVKRIMVKEPSLDDVFTYLTGARLRE
jgi:ABC-2 type transport system ATP-binding protein